MTICQFFLQGRCRFGDRCWNEHPGARGAGGGRQPPPPQQAPSGSNRRGWNASSQRYSNVIQPSSFPKSTPWGGSRDQDKPLFGSFESATSRGFGSSQNPFASPTSDEPKDEKKLLEGIVKDVEIWESSGQWMFSVYSPVKKKPNISGFTDISPEELRLEYHNLLTSNNLQSYLNSVQQLVSQWRNRINELKNLNMSTKGVLLSDGKDGVSRVAPAFGFGHKQTGTLGSSGFPVNNSTSTNAQSFSFKASPAFAAAPSGSTSVFGSHPAFGAGPSAGSAISSSAPAFGFGKPEATPAVSFSFKSPETSSFGSPGFSGFPASLAASPFGSAVAPAFGSGASGTGFGSPGPQSQTVFAKPHDVFGGSSASASLPVSSAKDNVLFTPRDQLTREELAQFQSQRFTLGKIPLKPPPVELLTV
ncbi:nucleoporin NUP42 isoform X1 [Meriones unguiculatus]|uniref:nucleoporin NUP42 isoform X1 n=1 Tax=Meriones unguiculatus TaxID=10047 RepID=UPI000B4F74A7|nr:nucleoporin NUP42 isoform X1 [Meriones unguiculatus]